MTWCRTSIAYTIALCELFNRDDECFAQECRVCSYGYEDIQFVIRYEIYEDEFDIQYYELSIRNKSGDNIVEIYAKDDLIAYKMFIELCCDYFISAFIELSYMYGGYKQKKEFDNQVKLEINQFFTERNYSDFEVKVI